MLCLMNSLLDRIAGNTIIKFTNVDPALLNVDAVVEEQDTNLILDNAPVIVNTIDSFPALVRKMEQQVLEVPGNVIVKHYSPKRFYAIIYDVEETPICRETWVTKAFKNIFIYCETYKIKVLAMPLLGTSHGKLEEEKIVSILQNVLHINRHKYLKKIFIYNK